jgi:hypothetical protein
MNLSVFLHYSSTQQAAIHVLHNDRVKSAEDIQNRMENQCYRGLHVLLIQKYRRLKGKKTLKAIGNDFYKPFANFFHGSTALTGLGLLVVEVSRTHSDTTLSRTPLYKESARGRDLYVTTHNTHQRQISTPLAEFEPSIPASQRPQTHALDHAATGIGLL